MPSITTRCASPALRTALLLLYYGAIVAALVFLYGRGDFTMPDFVYQGF